MSSSVVIYRGLGSVVSLDLAAGTVTIEHCPPSEHTGRWVVPLLEIEDVLYRERSVEHEGWGQIRTITGQHPDEPALDPYAFRNGGEQLKTFCVLISMAVTHARMGVEGRAARDVIGQEMSSIRDMLGRLRRD